MWSWFAKSTTYRRSNKLARVFTAFGKLVAAFLYRMRISRVRACTCIHYALQDRILSQDEAYGYEVIAKQLESKAIVRNKNKEKSSKAAGDLMELLPDSLQRSVKLASEKGSSTWLTVLPLSEHGFALHKEAFHDALALRYGWTPDRLPSKCTCGASFSVEHALSCAKGGYQA